MTSIVGGSSILHIANRLGGLKKDSIATDGWFKHISFFKLLNLLLCDILLSIGRLFNNFLNNVLYINSIHFFGIDSDRTFSATPPSGDVLSTPPSSERLTTPPSGDGLVTPPVEEMQREEMRLTLRLFKDKESYTTSPSTSNAQCAVNSRSDLSTAISQIQQQLATNHQMASSSQHVGLSGPSDILTMRDLLPGYSPWMRNAGRKKSHPVWDFFKDLKDTNGVGGVICLHCTWQGDDRSPNNLRTHLKKFHTVDVFSVSSGEKSVLIVSSISCFPGSAVGLVSLEPASLEPRWSDVLLWDPVYRLRVHLSVYTMDDCPSASTSVRIDDSVDVLALLKPSESMTETKKRHPINNPNLARNHPRYGIIIAC
uniref:BED-type domain-containing protein n=1 Tax=Heterorhabditis bacteriophora TaxID=37862 RepID=A0A1I7XRQ4_HETBA